MNQSKGLIAIDIDGTLTTTPTVVPLRVVLFLRSLALQGWQLLFVTGRTYHWSEQLLRRFAIPHYLLSVFNGAYTVKMPEQILIKKRYLEYVEVCEILKFVGDKDVAVAFYGDIERDAHSYIYRHHASHVLATHLQTRAKALQENWKELAHAHELPEESFVAMRLFCLPHIAKRLSLDIQEKYKVHAPMMRDSHDDQFSVVQITQRGVSKGHALDTALDYLGEHQGIPPLVIACGDDHNDIPMLERADIAVVMATAAPEVLKHADIIAPSSKKMGIISGIQSAIKKSEKFAK